MDAPKSRKLHITRLFGTNKNKDVLQDMWVDLERIESSKNKWQTVDGVHQGTQDRILWLDDPQDKDKYNPDGPKARVVEIVKVCDVENEEDPDDPEVWIPVPTIKSLRADGGDGNNQRYQPRWRNIQEADEPNDARKVEVRRIVHYDTAIDDDVQKFLDSDDTLKAYVVTNKNLDDYQKDTTTRDLSQYVETEVIKSMLQKGNRNAEDINDPLSGGHASVQTRVLHEYLIDNSEQATGDIVGKNGINPPYRLDPWQNIINISFAPRVYVVIIFGGSNQRAIVTTASNRISIIGTYHKDGSFVSGVLVECSSAAAGNFLSVEAPSCNMRWLVCPKTHEVLFNWKDFVTGPFHDDGIRPKTDRPFLWVAGMTVVGDEGATINFKIRYKPHLLAQRKGNTIVEMYPTSGASHATESPNEDTVTTTVITGWLIQVYRTDRVGTGQLYGQPPEWLSGENYHATFKTLNGTNTVTGKGLKFGSDPSRIKADVLYDGFDESEGV